MTERSESQHLQTPDGTDNDDGFENRLATGSDDSAGISTRILAGVLLALVFPWEITRRVVTTGIPWVARLLRDGSAATSKALGRGARRLARWLVTIGSRVSSAVVAVLRRVAAAARVVAGAVVHVLGSRRCWCVEGRIVVRSDERLMDQACVGESR